MKRALAFLSDLEKRNDRDWFQANKNRYLEASAVFERFVGDLLGEIGSFDDTILRFAPKQLIFRMQRDIRFSRDKSPYNPSFRACLGAGGKALLPVGYYVLIAPNNRSLLGGGLYAPTFKEATEAIRDRINDSGEAFEDIINEKAFKQTFIVQGEKLKNPPRGFDKTHPQIEYIKHKSWYLQYDISDEAVCADNFAKRAARIFKLMKPFNDYLNGA
ncbi:MAG: DUF2461 domain-containing protein, partial [Helicobacteraceae bacterium]|nr:DUF2461 domain-containing protein [Helicobacteraceae bacterium]